MLLLEDFEDNTVLYTTSTPEFHDGSNDYFTITPLNGNANSNSAYAGFGGTSFFAAEDLDDSLSRPSQGILSFNVDISGFEDLTLDMLFAAGNNDATPSYDANDGFVVRATIDSNPTQNLLAFEAAGATNQLLRQDTDFDGVGDGFLPSSTFSSFSGFSISGTGSNLLLEIIVDSNDGGSEFAFDNVTVNGNASVPEPTSLSIFAMAALGLVLRRRRN